MEFWRPAPSLVVPPGPPRLPVALSGPWWPCSPSGLGSGSHYWPELCTPRVVFLKLKLPSV